MVYEVTINIVFEIYFVVVNFRKIYLMIMNAIIIAGIARASIILLLLIKNVDWRVAITKMASLPVLCPPRLLGSQVGWANIFLFAHHFTSVNHYLCGIISGLNVLVGNGFLLPTLLISIEANGYKNVIAKKIQHYIVNWSVNRLQLSRYGRRKNFGNQSEYQQTAIC